MSREIKFKVWDKKQRKFYQLSYMGFLQQSDDLILVFNDRPSDYVDDYFRDTDQNNFVAMQYTGLKDKNGVEIYEGDIIKSYWLDFTDSEEISVVEWESDCWVLRYQIGGLSDRLNHPEVPFKEVIGNIYENKEFLNA